MKTFNEFIKEVHTITYSMAKKHKIYNKGKITNVGAGRAVPDRSPSSAGGDGD
jgi:hypothetical protein